MQVRSREFSPPGVARAARGAGAGTGLLEHPGFDVRRGEGAAFALQIWGPLPAAWAAALGSGLFQAGIRVVRGYARRIDADDGLPAGAWLGEFELEALDDAEEPVLVDYLALARAPRDAWVVPEPRLASYHRSLSGRHGGSIFLEVRARDRLGFLGGLLARVHDAGLVPEELVVDTRGAPVLDRFFLKEPDGRPPAREARRALGELLDQLSSPRTSPIP